MKRSLSEIIFGSARDPLDRLTRRKMALVAFLAWIGLGADGLSSANYGPAEAYLALGEHGELGLFLAVAMGVTVFLIAIGYNQVIELFPTGGGGYKVASNLLGPYAGLIAGCALVVDFGLTVTISVAAGTDALFSLLPLAWQPARVAVAGILILVLAWLNLRGIKESILVLMPIFLGFLATHTGFVLAGLGMRTERLTGLGVESFAEASTMADQTGWLVVLAILLRAYSLGAGTYTGIEAVSNSVQVLAEPRVRTGKATMLYMAVTLAFMATGLMLLYLTWQVVPVEGQTLNAAVFRLILADLEWFGQEVQQAVLLVTLACAAGLLFVAANAGFLGGPAVLANMASDQWMPHQFSHLSSRLVTHVGIVLMALGALLLLVATGGEVEVLVVLYSINVFITFTLCLSGLCVYWLRHRAERPDWPRGLAVAGTALITAAAILLIIIIEKFLEGGWISIVVTALLATACLAVRAHYRRVAARLRSIDRSLRGRRSPAGPPAVVAPDPSQPTAVLLLGSSYGAGMHSLLWIQRLFPGHFKNFVLVSVGEVDAHSFGGRAAIGRLKRSVTARLKRFAQTCHAQGYGTASYQAFGTDVVAEVAKLAPEIQLRFPNVVFFAPKLEFDNETLITRLLHNHTALLVQRRLLRLGIHMMVLPLRLDAGSRRRRPKPGRRR